MHHNTKGRRLIARSSHNLGRGVAISARESWPLYAKSRLLRTCLQMGSVGMLLTNQVMAGFLAAGQARSSTRTETMIHLITGA